MDIDYIYYIYVIYIIYISQWTTYYSGTKKNETLPLATTWINLEGIMLSEISQSEKGKCCMISLIRVI